MHLWQEKLEVDALYIPFFVCSSPSGTFLHIHAIKYTVKGNVYVMLSNVLRRQNNGFKCNFLFFCWRNFINKWTYTFHQLNEVLSCSNLLSTKSSNELLWSIVILPSMDVQIRNLLSTLHEMFQGAGWICWLEYNAKKG